ncbi:MAG: hypothetical protein ABI175_00190 [Polyangiales bacterium]
MRPMRLLVPCLLVVVTTGLGVACGSDPPVAPNTPFAVGPSGGDLWQPEEKAEPTATATLDTPPPVASVTVAPPVTASASASGSAKKPAASATAKPKATTSAAPTAKATTSAVPTPKPTASTK